MVNSNYGTAYKESGYFCMQVWGDNQVCQGKLFPWMDINEELFIHKPR